MDPLLAHLPRIILTSANDDDGRYDIPSESVGKPRRDEICRIVSCVGGIVRSSRW